MRIIGVSLAAFLLALLILLPIPRQTARTIARLLDGTGQRPDTVAITDRLNRARVDAALSSGAEHLSPRVRQARATRGLATGAARELARKDSIERLQLVLVARLDSARRVDAAMDARVAQARALNAESAPFAAYPAAAVVIGFVIGFGLVFGAELRTPRVADAAEATRITGVTTLVTIIPGQSDTEGRRRSADAALSPLIDIRSEPYRRLSTQVSDAAAAAALGVPLIAVIGDEASLVAIVASNLAVASARDSRTTLLIDADPDAAATSAILRIPRRPGVSDVLTGRAAWSAVMVNTPVGRDASLDVIPCGRQIRDTTPIQVRAFDGNPAGTSETEPVATRARRRTDIDADVMRSDLLRLGRRYDLIVMAAPAGATQIGPDSVLPVLDCLLCLRVAFTTIARLRIAASLLQESGLQIRGMVVWDTDDPPPTAMPV